MLGNGLTFPFTLLSSTHGGKWLAGPGCFTLKKACLFYTVWEAEELKAGRDIRTKVGALVLAGNRSKLLGRPARSPVIIPTAHSLLLRQVNCDKSLIILLTTVIMAILLPHAPILISVTFIAILLAHKD